MPQIKKNDLVWVNYEGLHWAAIVQDKSINGKYNVYFLIDNSESTVNDKKIMSFAEGFLYLYSKKKSNEVRERNVFIGTCDFLHFCTPPLLKGKLDDHEKIYEFFKAKHCNAFGSDLDTVKRMRKNKARDLAFIKVCASAKARAEVKNIATGPVGWRRAEDLTSLEVAKPGPGVPLSSPSALSKAAPKVVASAGSTAKQRTDTTLRTPSSVTEAPKPPVSEASKPQVRSYVTSSVSSSERCTIYTGVDVAQSMAVQGTAQYVTGRVIGYYAKISHAPWLVLFSDGACFCIDDQRAKMMRQNFVKIFEMSKLPSSHQKLMELVADPARTSPPSIASLQKRSARQLREMGQPIIPEVSTTKFPKNMKDRNEIPDVGKPYRDAACRESSTGLSSVSVIRGSPSAEHSGELVDEHVTNRTADLVKFSRDGVDVHVVQRTADCAKSSSASVDAHVIKRSADRAAATKVSYQDIPWQEARSWLVGSSKLHLLGRSLQMLDSILLGLDRVYNPKQNCLDNKTSSAAASTPRTMEAPERALVRLMLITEDPTHRSLIIVALRHYMNSAIEQERSGTGSTRSASDAPTFSLPRQLILSKHTATFAVPVEDMEGQQPHSSTKPQRRKSRKRKWANVVWRSVEICIFEVLAFWLDQSLRYLGGMSQPFCEAEQLDSQDTFTHRRDTNKMSIAIFALFTKFSSGLANGPAANGAREDLRTGIPLHSHITQMKSTVRILGELLTKAAMAERTNISTDLTEIGKRCCRLFAGL